METIFKFLTAMEIIREALLFLSYRLESLAANDRMVALHFRQAVKPQWEIPGSNGNFVPIGPLIVQSPAHIEVFRFVSGSSTHKKASLPFFG